MDKKCIINLTNVNKQFNGIDVLKDISTSFEMGKIHGILGRNGSGKTMLLKCICGLIPTTSGQIVVEEKCIGKDVEMAQNMGILIEAPGFLMQFSGYKNLKMLADLNKKITKEEIHKVMADVGLNWEDKKKVSKYSLGMKQRLGIAQAIMEKPHILLLDEPLNGIDLDGMKEMRKLFLELKKQGATILLATHNEIDIESICDTWTIIDGGKIISEKK